MRRDPPLPDPGGLPSALAPGAPPVPFPRLQARDSDARARQATPGLHLNLSSAFSGHPACRKPLPEPVSPPTKGVTMLSVGIKGAHPKFTEETLGLLPRRSPSFVSSRDSPSRMGLEDRSAPRCPGSVGPRPAAVPPLRHMPLEWAQ